MSSSWAAASSVPASPYYLAKSDWRVTVIDQGKHGMLCSHANCGLVSPSHILPLAMPGAIRKNIKLMLQKNSPFYVKPRFDPTLWGWLTRFALRCRHEPMVQAGHAQARTLEFVPRALYDQLMADEHLEAEFQRKGVCSCTRLRGHLMRSTKKMSSRGLNTVSRRGN